jgi:hypothetical protein
MSAPNRYHGAGYRTPHRWDDAKEKRFPRKRALSNDLDQVQVRAYRVLHLKTLVAFDHTPWADKSPGWVHAGSARVRFDLDQLNGGEQRIAFRQSFDVAMRSSQPHWVFKPFAKDPPNDKSPALGNSRAGLFAGILRVGRLTPECGSLLQHVGTGSGA